jgi:hypothetical protein
MEKELEEIAKGYNEIRIQQTELYPTVIIIIATPTHLIEYNDKKYVLIGYPNVPEIIMDLLDKGFVVNITNIGSVKTKLNGGVAYRIPGFAKAEYLYLQETDKLDEMIASGRYTEPVTINSFDDILNIAREEHRAKPEFGISSNFFKYFEEKGWIETVENNNHHRVI